MLKKINRILRLFGFNLVHAKRRAPKSESQRVKEFVAEFTGDAEWQAVLNPNVAVGYAAKKTVVNPDAAFVPVDIDGPTDAEWETSGGTTPEQNEARFERPRVEQPNSANKTTGASS